MLGSRRRASTASAGQLSVFFGLLFIYAVLVFLSYLWFPVDQMIPAQALPGQTEGSVGWQQAATFSVVIFFAYGLLGLLGLWFASRLNLPGVYRERAGWGAWLVQPLLVGAFVGVIIVVGDQLFAAQGEAGGFLHPPFPLSIIASGTAGIGEEIIFRVFVLGFWALIFDFLLGRRVVPGLALWIGNILGALAFAAGHLPSVMYLYGVTNPADLPPTILTELLVLNAVLGLVAGERYMKQGLVAAVGVHFWADIVWHVIFPMTGLAG